MVFNTASNTKSYSCKVPDPSLATLVQGNITASCSVTPAPEGPEGRAQPGDWASSRETSSGTCLLSFSIPSSRVEI